MAARSQNGNGPSAAASVLKPKYIGAASRKSSSRVGGGSSKLPPPPSCIDNAATISGSLLIVLIERLPLGSALFIGLFRQYANRFAPSTPCPVLAYPSALINLPSAGS